MPSLALVQLREVVGKTLNEEKCVHAEACAERRRRETEPRGERGPKEVRGERDVVLERGVERGPVRYGDEYGYGGPAKVHYRTIWWTGAKNGAGVVGDAWVVCVIREEVGGGRGEEFVCSPCVAEVSEQNAGGDAEVESDVPPEREVCARLCGRWREVESVQAPYRYR